jgi:hypothetical protein
MQTPIDIPLGRIALAVTAICGDVVAWQAIAPARTRPAIRGWRLKTRAAFLAHHMISPVRPLLPGKTPIAFRLPARSRDGDEPGLAA